MISAGQRTQRFRVLEKRVIRDDAGAQVETLVEKGKCWAFQFAKSGVETLNGGMVAPMYQVKLNIRYFPGLTETDVLERVSTGKRYEIVSLQELGRREEHELLVTENRTEAA